MFSVKSPVRSTLGLVSALAATFCLSVAVPRVASQAAPIDNLQQSIDVIKQILDKEGLYTRTTTSGASYKSQTERKFSLKSANGCQMVVASDAHTHTEMPQQQRVVDRTWTDIYRPDFSNLDSATVIVQDPQPPQSTWETKGFLVRIGVEIGKPPIAASSVNKETNLEKNLPGLPNLAVYVTSREQADRLAKAFTQVATACHAK